jgi:hypothetical protein
MVTARASRIGVATFPLLAGIVWSTVVSLALFVMISVPGGSDA